MFYNSKIYMGVFTLMIGVLLSNCTNKLNLNSQYVLPPDHDPNLNEEIPSGPGFDFWKAEAQPVIEQKCSSCHMGTRFGFSTLKKAGSNFSEDESIANYNRFFNLISLDIPEKSRLVAKILPSDDPKSMSHGGPTLPANDPSYQTLIKWIKLERQNRCPKCGTNSDVSFIAYLDQPSVHWGISDSPIRLDYGIRKGAKIMLQKVDNKTLLPSGTPITFLPATFCGSNGECDFGKLASNYEGTELVFECRMAWNGEKSWVDVSWNICIAGIGPDGKAVNPRFLIPPERRHSGWTVSRINPFGLIKSDGSALYGNYDSHVKMRKREDITPTFSPDNKRIVFSSRGPEPLTGINTTETYHGFRHSNNIVSVNRDGSDPQRIYLNEGGEADFPTFLKNGNIIFHTWNLERMDLHMYTQTTADGMNELPVVLGRTTHGRSLNWRSVTETANGALIGVIGVRRGTSSGEGGFVSFSFDHSLGTDIEATANNFRVHDLPVLGEQDNTFAYCDVPPEGRNCFVSHYYNDASYAPDGRALITYSPGKTYMFDLYLRFAGDLQAMLPYVPNLNIAAVDINGNVQRLLVPPSGHSFRYPAWVGKRQAPIIQKNANDTSKNYSDLHIANFPIWLSLQTNTTEKSTEFASLEKIKSVRVLLKEADKNSCLNDGLPYRKSVWHTEHDHPSHLGISNGTGYRQFLVPSNLGGDEYGDIPLQPDGSVYLRVPANKLLLLQGIDAEGHLVNMHRRVFALPPGRVINTSVKKSQYAQQCMACHGNIDQLSRFAGLSETSKMAPKMDFETDAFFKGPVDLQDSQVVVRKLTFLHALRPILDQKCISCHGGTQPAGDFYLGSKYSTHGNYPKGKWAVSGGVPTEYSNFVPVADRVPDFAWSVARAYILDRPEYRATYIPPNEPFAPTAELSPWDPGYNYLFQTDSSRNNYYYLTSYPYSSHVGRGGRFSVSSFLLEVLTGKEMDSRKNFTGPDHTKYLSESEIRLIKGLIDNGFPYMESCEDSTVQSGPNKGLPWGDPEPNVVK